MATIFDRNVGTPTRNLDRDRGTKHPPFFNSFYLLRRTNSVSRSLLPFITLVPILRNVL